jgi:pyrroloquinoline quinone (PQQ) biosynthesis protein C
MNSPTEMFPPEQFSEALLNAVAGYPLENTRAYHLLVSRKCPLSLIQRYARSTYLSTSLLCATLPELIENAPNDTAKLVLLNNLLEEEGIHLSASKGLVVRPEARHPALAFRFAIACGADQDLKKNPLSAVSQGRDFLSQGRWLEAIAFILVGQELPFSHTSTLIMNALIGQGYSAKDLGFFAVHREADKRHGQEALDLVINNSHSREQQNAALQAAREGAHHVFSLHGGMAKKYLNHSDTEIKT